MVCSNCTLFHPIGVMVCSKCGSPLYSKLDGLSLTLSRRLPTFVGISSGGALLTALSVALMAPAVAAQALNIGAYFGIVSITNMWLSVNRNERSDRLQGMRGFVFGAVLTISLIGEMARLLGLSALQLPSLLGHLVNIPVPSALLTESVAALLLVVDPLIVSPLVTWIAEGTDIRPSGE